MARFTFIRHGHTQWNIEKRFTGMTDIPLSAEGRSGLSACRSKILSQNFVACYCSPLLRTQETAQLILEGTDLHIILDPRLQELGLGTWEGMLFADIEKNFGDALQRRREDPLHTPAPGGGETLFELGQRVATALQDFEARHAAEDAVLIVSHGVVLSFLRALQNGDEVASIWQNNRVAPGGMLEWDSQQASWKSLLQFCVESS